MKGVSHGTKEALKALRQHFRLQRGDILCSHTAIRMTGGDSRDRTGDLLLARQALSQLSYTPIFL